MSETRPIKGAPLWQSYAVKFYQGDFLKAQVFGFKKQWVVFVVEKQKASKDPSLNAHGQTMASRS